MKIEQASETEVAQGARVDAHPHRAGMAEVRESLVRAAVVLVEGTAGQDLLAVGVQLGVVDDPADETTKIGVLQVQLARVVVALGLEFSVKLLISTWTE